MALLEVDDLRTHFFTREGVVRAVDGVSFSLEKGKTLGIVGESGCGKSVTALSIMGLIPKPPAKIVHGDVLFEGRDLTKLTERKLEDVRGREIALPPVTRPFRARMPRRASEVTLLPHPDSPTIPSVSPGAMSKEIPLTA